MVSKYTKLTETSSGTTVSLSLRTFTVIDVAAEIKIKV